jgi:GH25 family lysozyme M1 (1,4-beta-N-acetylmuramidase)
MSLLLILSTSIVTFAKEENIEPVLEPSCSTRPTYEAAVVARPNRNRPFAWNPQMQKVPGPFGIDISRWDHPNNKLLDFPTIKNQGFEFALIKLSDGATIEANNLAKKWWRIDRPAAQSAGFLVGGYHYAFPRGNSPAERELDALKQARQASREYGNWAPGRLPLVLDFEVLPTSRWTPREMTDWALSFLEEAERLTGRPPMIYSYANFFLKHMEPDLRLARFPLWIAHYGVHLKAPAPIVPWSLFDGYAIWQFSSSGRTLGTHRNVGDLNQSSEHWLRTLSGRKTDYPWAEPLSQAQIAAFNQIAKNGNGERFHKRTGSTRDGLTTWQTWINTTDRCTTLPQQP